MLKLSLSRFAAGFLFVSLAVQATAQTAVQSDKARGNAKPVRASASAGLPLCISDEVTIEKIIAIQKANPKNPSKYDGYREVFKESSPTELLARLAYAETLAANCPELNFKIAPLIIESITNRIRIRKGDVQSVVYQRDQHASSMNIYKESRYREFLCPQDSALWEAVYNAAQNALASTATGQVLARDAVHYYLYKHSDRHKVPKWASDESEWAISEVPESAILHPCIRFFRNPRWR